MSRNLIKGGHDLKIFDLSSTADQDSAGGAPYLNVLDYAYMFRSRADQYHFMYSPASQRILRDPLEGSHGLKFLFTPAELRGIQLGLSWEDKPTVTSVEQLAGTKNRVTGTQLGRIAMQALNLNPVPMAWEEMPLFILTGDLINTSGVARRLSGIGRGEVLQAAGVDVRHELPGVGENLQDHLKIRLVYEVNVPTLRDAINNIVRRGLIGVEYTLRRTGPMSLGAGQVCILALHGPAGNTGHPISLSAALGRQARHGNASVFRFHVLGLPAAPGKPRNDPHHIARCRSVPNDQTEPPAGHGRSALRQPGGEIRPRNDPDRRACTFRGAQTCPGRATRDGCGLPRRRPQSCPDNLSPDQHLPHGRRRVRGRG